MKKSFYFLLFAVPMLILQSCAVSENWRINEKSATRDLQGRGSDASVLVKPVMAELDIANIRKESTYLFTSDTLNMSKSKISFSSEAKETAKSFALFQFMKDNNCDYVLDPLYHITRSGNSNSATEDISVTISGYTAKYKSFSQPDTLPRSIFESQRMNRGNVLIASSKFTKKEAFEPFFAAGLGLNLGFDAGALGLPDLHARYYAKRYFSIGYDFLNMKDYYSSEIKSKDHILSANINLYNKGLNGIHFTGGLALPTYDGIFDIDGFGFAFGAGGQFVIADKIALRADYRLSTNFGGSFGIGASYCFH